MCVAWSKNVQKIHYYALEMKEKCPNANIFLAFCHRGVSIMFSIMIRVLFNGEGVSKCQLWSLQHKEQIYI